MGRNSKGARRERELVNKLYENGFAVIRSPSSGARTERELPDILTGNLTSLYGIEVKSSSGDVIYIDEQEVIDLKFLCKMFSSQPRIAVRFDYEDWYFFHPNDLYRTQSGNYRIKKETAISEGVHYSNFILPNKTQASLDDITLADLLLQAYEDIPHPPSKSTDLEKDSILDAVSGNTVTFQLTFTDREENDHVWEVSIEHTENT